MKAKIFLIIFSLVFSLNHCSQSPLLNHTQSKVEPTGTVSTFEATCPLNFSKLQICAEMKWLVGPLNGEESSFLLKFWDKKTSNLNGPYLEVPYLIEVDPRMDTETMHHGTSWVEVLQVDTGVYKATPVYLFMGGEWKLNIKLKQSEKVVLDNVVFSVNVPF
jgi:hypothetical protein